MARWLGELDPAELSLLSELRLALASHKPPGWSIVQGPNSLTLRPPNRGSGKFSIVLVEGEVTAAFHDRSRGVWTERERWPANPGVAGQILAWATGLVG